MLLMNGTILRDIKARPINRKRDQRLEQKNLFTSNQSNRFWYTTTDQAGLLNFEFGPVQERKCEYTFFENYAKREEPYDDARRR